MEEKIVNWIMGISKSEVLPENIKAINIGLFESAENCYMIYMVGSEKYNPNNSDWACNNDFVPNEKYFKVDNKDLNKLQWNYFQNEIVIILNNFLKSEKYKESIFFKVSNITLGFDDGDLQVIK